MENSLAMVDSVIQEVIAFAIYEAAYMRHKNVKSFSNGFHYASVKVIATNGQPAFSSSGLNVGNEGQYHFYSKLMKSCMSRGIKVYENFRKFEKEYVGSSSRPSIGFDVPVSVIDSTIRDFTDVLRTRRSDVVGRLAESVLSQENNHEDIFLTDIGLLGYDDETSESIIAFASLGLKPLYNMQVLILSNCVIEHIRNQGKGNWVIVENEHSCLRRLDCIFRREKAAPGSVQLSNW